MIRAVVFDLDDTLYPEVEFVYSGYRIVSEAVYKQWGFKIYDELVALFEEGQRGDLFTPVLRKHLRIVKESYVQQLVKIYRQHIPRIHPFPEVLKVLDKLKPLYRLAIISDGLLSVQERKLRVLGIGHYCDEIIFSDKWGQNFWKPHPWPYEECVRRLFLEPASMVYVGDNPNKDFVTPRRIGMKTVRVRRIGTLHWQVRLSPEFEADYEISDLGKILTLLQSMEHHDACPT